MRANLYPQGTKHPYENFIINNEGLVEYKLIRRKSKFDILHNESYVMFKLPGIKEIDQTDYYQYTLSNFTFSILASYDQEVVA